MRVERRQTMQVGLIAIVLAAALAFAIAALAPGASQTANAAGKHKKHKPRVKRYHGPKIKTPASSRCDFLDTSVCMFPFPNDYFTIKSKATPTHVRVNFSKDSMPKDTPYATPNQHFPIQPTEYNRADGYSPGSSMILHIPGMDNQAAFDATGIVPVSDIHRYADTNQPVVVIDAATHQRQPIFAELDYSEPGTIANSDRDLMIRPTVNLKEGHHYIVALRSMKKSNGAKIAPPNAFKVYRDKLITKQRPVEKRRKHFESLFKSLGKAHIARKSLYIAWDFTVASQDSLSGRALAMRDDAFAKLGDTNLSDLTVQGNSPAFSITGTTDYTIGENADITRKVTGTLDDVPCYLNQNGCAPGSSFDFASKSAIDPTFHNYTMDVPFTCVIPRSVSDGNNIVPARPVLYGHGLLGSQNEVTGSAPEALAQQADMVLCAVDWAGFSGDDVGPVILPSLAELSFISKTFDRTQQGFVNFMMLGRAMIHATQGFNTNAAFQVDPDGAGVEPAAPVLDTNRLFYDGNSQGGIMGGALTALDPDLQRATLGVPAMNYSTLLQRSTDFTAYAELEHVGLYDSYPNRRERPLILALLQMLWDRGEADGYAQHMTSSPLPDTPAHQVLMQLAYGDHQVSNLAAETEARTVGAQLMTPALDATRHWEANPFFGLTPISTYPFTGSAIEYWDGGPAAYSGTLGFGTDLAPLTNSAPSSGGDPHSYPRKTVEARQHVSDFLKVGGSLLGGCAGGNPCYSNGWTGIP